ncbi:MAG TPA: hypothetical protein PKE31_18710 [Pseudomonadota bacterium]|nr:hypothetical protein [Pseudomonadota bacterium]
MTAHRITRHADGAASGTAETDAGVLSVSSVKCGHVELVAANTYL